MKLHRRAGTNVWVRAKNRSTGSNRRVRLHNKEREALIKALRGTVVCLVPTQSSAGEQAQRTRASEIHQAHEEAVERDSKVLELTMTADLTTEY